MALLRLQMLLILSLLVVGVGSNLCGRSAVDIDFSSVTNPSVAMEWHDANGQLFTGTPNGGLSALIPYEATDTSGGAFPGGSIRWRNLGSDNGQPFDLLVTVSSNPAVYSETVAVEYNTQISSIASQGVFTTAGYACIGFGVRPSLCVTGSLVLATATCSDGSEPVTRAAEFSFQFVKAGTLEAVDPFALMYTTFFDVDGDTVNGGEVYEFVTILGATRTIIAPSSTVETDVFSPSEALYASSTGNVNIDTDFSVNPRTPSSS